MQRHLPLLAIVLAYLAVGTLFAVLTPAWQAPDEPAHFNVVRQLAAGDFPVMEPGDYDQAYLTEVVFESAFAPQYDLTIIEYEDWQPPLYYLLQTPVFWLSGGSLTALRLFSVLLGAGVVVLAYAIALRLFPAERWLALTVAAFVAFLPQHVAIMASVNNDSLAELLLAGMLFLLIGIADRRRDVATWELLLVGVLLGLGYLTKGTVYPISAVVGLLLLWRYWREWSAFVRAALVVFVPAGLLGALWWLRNVALYGGLDMLGKANHDTIVVGQPRMDAWIAANGLGATAEQFVRTTFQSFWGQFGWMTVPMTHPGWLYPLLAAFTAFVVVGLLIALVRPKSWAQDSAMTRPQAAVLLGLLLLTLGVYLGYNLTFVQFQGRYLFPALIPIGLGVAIGLGVWTRPMQSRYPWIQSAIPLGLSLALIGLDLYALFRVILPALG